MGRFASSPMEQFVLRRTTHRPNGLTIPPTGDRIYIADTGVHQPWLPGPEFAPNETTRPRHIRVYPISSDCTVDQANGKLFASIKVGAADGIRTDVHGNVWACCGDGIHVFSPEGELLGKIRTPFSAVNMVGFCGRAPSFCAGSDGSLQVWGSPNYNEILLCAHNQVWKIAGVKEGLKRVDGNGKL